MENYSRTDRQNIFWKLICSDSYEDNLIALDLYDEQWAYDWQDVLNEIAEYRDRIHIGTYNELIKWEKNIRLVPIAEHFPHRMIISTTFLKRYTKYSEPL